MAYLHQKTRHDSVERHSVVVARPNELEEAAGADWAPVGLDQHVETLLAGVVLPGDAAKHAAELGFTPFAGIVGLVVAQLAPDFDGFHPPDFCEMIAVANGIRSTAWQRAL